MFDKRSDLIRLLAVAEAGAITVAAHRLAISQPALTRVVARLERRVGGPLFERTANGVQLTTLGDTVAENARCILREISLAEERVNAARLGRTGSVSVTADPMWADAVLPEAIVRFHEDYPAVELKLATASRQQGLRLLAEGRSDLHFGGIDEGERLPSNVRRERFIEMTAGIVASRGHPLLAGEVTIDDLARFPWIDFDPSTTDVSDDGPFPSDFLARVFKRNHTRVHTVVRSASAGLFLMATGRYLAWLPLNFLERLPGLSLLPVPTSIGRYRYRSGFAARRSAGDSAPLVRLEDFVRETALGRRA